MAVPPGGPRGKRQRPVPRCSHRWGYGGITRLVSPDHPHWLSAAGAPLKAPEVASQLRALVLRKVFGFGPLATRDGRSSMRPGQRNVGVAPRAGLHTRVPTSDGMLVLRFLGGRASSDAQQWGLDLPLWVLTPAWRWWAEATCASSTSAGPAAMERQYYYNTEHKPQATHADAPCWNTWQT